MVDEFDIAGVTDVTGFGLAGHMLEMLEASRLKAKLQLDSIPLLPGVEELISDGVESTLAPANRAAEDAIVVAEGLSKSPQYQAMFDPQTSGGLLLGVPPPKLKSLRERLCSLGVLAAEIGEVTSQASATIVVH